MSFDAGDNVYIMAYHFHVDYIAGNVLRLSLKRLIPRKKVVDQQPCKK
jgi:hypothetical protein